MRERSALLAAVSLLVVAAAAGCNDSSAADAQPAPSAAAPTTVAPTTVADAAPTTQHTDGGGGNGGDRVAEFPIEYPADRMAHGTGAGSTHELTPDPAGDAFWITGQNESTIVKAALDGSMQTFEMPEGSGPHGIAFDAKGQLWVTLEFAGEIVRLDPAGTIVQTIDIKIPCASCAQPLNPSPHGLAVGGDGATLWFTGKSMGTIGRISPDGTVATYQIPTVGSVPIYIEQASDGTMWFTELVGNAIGRVTPDGVLTEFKIPTANSRPISLVQDPQGGAMWFSEEAGNKVARITLDGTITEFPVPMVQPNNILAALSFDDQGDLWVQQYVNPRQPAPDGDDHIVEIDRDIRTADPGNLDNVTFTYHTTPSTDTVMHRIVLGPDGALWFTELSTNRLGRIAPT